MGIRFSLVSELRATFSTCPDFYNVYKVIGTKLDEKYHLYFYTLNSILSRNTRKNGVDNRSELNVIIPQNYKTWMKNLKRQ